MGIVLCKNHPEEPALWQCKGCGAAFCQPCVIDTPSIPPAALCRTCGGRCTSLKEAARPGASKSFLAELPKSFIYALSPKALAMNLGSIIFLFGASLLMIIPVIGWILAFLIAGYMCAFMLKIIVASAKGEDQVPSWPELTNWFDDAVKPFLIVIVTTLLAQAPALAYSLGVRGWQEMLEGPDWVTHVLQIAGALYLPMAFLAIAMFHSFVALNPFFIFGSILKVPFEYVCVYGMFLVVYGVRLAAHHLAAAIPFAGWAVALFFPLYFLMVECRILGVLYAANVNKLRWFEEHD